MAGVGDGLAGRTWAATPDTVPRVAPALEIASIGEGVDAQEASSAAAAALGDDRLAELLRTNSHRVESVRAADSSVGLVVSVRFDAPLGTEAPYPLEACAIETNGAPITGLRWLVQGNDIICAGCGNSLLDFRAFHRGSARRLGCSGRRRRSNAWLAVPRGGRSRL